MPKMTRRRFIRDILSFPRVRKELSVSSLSFRNKEQVSDNLRAMIDIDAMDTACRKFMVSMKAACLYHQKLDNATLNIFMVLLSLDNKGGTANKIDYGYQTIDILSKSTFNYKIAAYIVWEWSLFRGIPIYHDTRNKKTYLYKQPFESKEQASLARLNSFCQRHSIPEASELRQWLLECRELSLNLNSDTHTFVTTKKGKTCSFNRNGYTLVMPYKFCDNQSGHGGIILTISEKGRIFITLGACRKDRDTPKTWHLTPNRLNPINIKFLPVVSTSYIPFIYREFEILETIKIDETEFCVSEPLADDIAYNKNDTLARTRVNKLEQAVAYFLFRALPNKGIVNSAIMKAITSRNPSGYQALHALRKHCINSSIAIAKEYSAEHSIYSRLRQQPYLIEFLDNYPALAKYILKQEQYAGKTLPDWCADIVQAVNDNTSITHVFKTHGFEKRFIAKVFRAKTRTITFPSPNGMTHQHILAIQDLWLRFEQADLINPAALSKSEYNMRRNLILDMGHYLVEYHIPRHVIRMCRPTLEWFASGAVENLKDTLHWLDKIYLEPFAGYIEDGKTLHNIGLIKTIEDVIRLTKWHHNNIERVNVLTSKFSPNERIVWECPIPDFHCEDGTIHFLKTLRELQQEGQEMKHCVGGYADRCFLGQDIIGAVSAVDGTRSTITLSGLSDDRLPEDFLKLTENKTVNNASPTGKALDVLRRFQESIPDLIQKDYSDYKAMLHDRINQSVRRKTLEGMVLIIEENFMDFVFLFKDRGAGANYVDALREKVNTTIHLDDT